MRIVVVTQQIDLSDPVGRVITAVLLGSEAELGFRRERQVAGIEVAREKDVYKGRKPGTTKGEPERAKELRDRGLTAAEIAQALGTSERTVFRYPCKSAAYRETLTNPIVAASLTGKAGAARAELPAVERLNKGREMGAKVRLQQWLLSQDWP